MIETDTVLQTRRRNANLTRLVARENRDLQDEGRHPIASSKVGEARFGITRSGRGIAVPESQLLERSR